MSKAISERVELAKLCGSRDWSKAIRVIDSLLACSPSSVQDICNRAFCYSQLELHKHVIKDCDRALQLDPALLQAYILKGRALSSLGRKDDALLVWGQGYEHALCYSTDLKQLLELEELLKSVNQGRSTVHDNCVPELGSLKDASESRAYSNGKLSEVPRKQEKLSNLTYLSGKTAEESKTHNKSGDNFGMPNGGSDENGVENSSQLQNGTADEAGHSSTMPLAASEHCVIGSFKSSISEPSKIQDKCQIPSDWRDTLENCSSVDEFDVENGLSDEAGKIIKPQTESNGSNHFLDQQSDDLESFINSSEVSRSSNSGDTSDVQIKFGAKSNVHNEGGDELKRSKKFSVAKISKTKSISVDFRLSRGIAQVNEGKYATAISIFDQILKGDPNYPEALIGRGTAYAFQRELEAAIADFSKAIQSNPSAGEAWKRRGQARAALGESVEAIEDLTKALEFEPNSADILHERGIVNFKFKDYDAAIEDLSACVELDKENKSAYTYLGLALASVGEHKRAEEAHLKSIQLDRNMLEAWAHLTQFYLDLANSTKALECIEQVLHIDVRFAKAYHLRGRLLHGMGEHRKAIKDLSISLKIDKSNIDSLYLRASCYHAVGDYVEAVKDYDATLDLELDSIEKFVLQCLAFYQKEIALYTASKTNTEFCWFDIDGDIDPLFKEYWCKRLHPKNVCEKVYRQTPLRESLKRGKLRKQDFAFTKHKTALIAAADSIGKKIQYNCPGFLPNRRQHRMAGMAAIEIAQKVSKVWRSLQAEWKHLNRGTPKYGKRPRRRINIHSQNRGGAGCSTSSSSEASTSYGVGEDRSSGRSLMSWHDIYSLAVKWRQISEPCDPVVWINKLSEEFNSGFGSNTPMVLGQAKVVRYYPNFERTLNVAKSIIKDKMCVYNKADEIIPISDDEKLQDIMNAKSCSDLYSVVGEDFWVATRCGSTAYEGKQLEGTRITFMKDERGFDFAIRTPCTPSRWDDFDEEMTKAWEAICSAYCGETYGSLDFSVLENIREAILRLTYYWYNFMPLSRGSAVVGFVVLLGLLLAANMKFTGEIPKDLQVDWEAILNFDRNDFVETVKSWLYPCLKVSSSWKDYPDVSSTFSTTGSVVAALSSYDN